MDNHDGFVGWAAAAAAGVMVVVVVVFAMVEMDRQEGEQETRQGGECQRDGFRSDQTRLNCVGM